MRNLARKSTHEERRTKKAEKLMADRTTTQKIDGALHVAVFRLLGILQDPRARFKVVMNAKQLCLTGALVLLLPNPARDYLDDVNAIVVEGGEKGIRKFKRLVSSRIKWDQVEVSPDHPSPLTCEQVWEGFATSAGFHSFKVEECRSVAEAAKFFRDKGVSHYWESVFKDGASAAGAAPPFAL